MQGEKVMSPTILHKACGHTLAVALPHTLSLALPPASFAIVSNTCIRELTLCFFQVQTPQLKVTGYMKTHFSRVICHAGSH
jgi:hypothetical protein